MDNSTNINDLPLDPIGCNDNNIGMSISNNNIENKQPTQSGDTLDGSTISQLVNGIQKISNTGVTTLPSRDIPKDTQELTNDAQIQANFIPPPPTNDYYIDDENDNAALKYSKNENNNNIDKIYDEFQLPLLLSVLYFIFQLPFVRRMMFKYIPILFTNDGNYNLYGLFFTSSLFSFIYYLLAKSINYFNTF